METTNESTMSETMKTNWLLLSYKIPPEPAKARVAVWRKIKACGAVYLQNSVCVIPNTSEHQRILRLLQNDIITNAGEAFVLEAAGLDDHQDNLLTQRFNQDRDEEYEEFLDKCNDFEKEIEKETANEHFTYAELQENEEDLKKLKNWLDKIRKLDFCNAPKGEEAAQRLVKCEHMLDDYANTVFQKETSKLSGS